jgi:lipopolysaccharide export system protein LptC
MNIFPPDAKTVRGEAFEAARRHSGRVKLLKRGIILFSVGSIATLLAISFLDPFGKLPKNFTAGPTSLNGSRITMEKPRLSGYRNDGRPYDLRATSGVQDVRSPNIIELSELDAKIDTAEQSSVHLIAPRGVYDSAKDTMVLEGDIRITSGSGYDIRLRSANVNFKSGAVASDDPLTVVMTSGAIAANSLRISENGKKISFGGGVETILKPVSAETQEGRGP